MLLYLKFIIYEVDIRGLGNGKKYFDRYHLYCFGCYGCAFMDGLN